MSALEVILLFVGFLIAMAMAGVVAAVAGLLIAASRAEKRERAAAMAEHEDQALDVARAEPWTGDNVTVPRERTRRLSEGWIVYAEQEMDWHALEYMATGKRTEVSTDGR